MAASAQMVKPIDGAEGWLQYTAKHGARGMKHYQRVGRPPGWESMPQVWSRGGDWPLASEDLTLDRETFWRMRRLVRAWVAAERRTDLRRAERYGDLDAARRARRSLGYVQGMLRCSDPSLSAVRGARDWCPQDVTLALATVAGWAGEVA